MRLKISHETRYTYDRPVEYGLQQVRLTPRTSAVQSVLSWSIAVEGGRPEVEFTDQHRNRVTLISIDAGRTDIRVSCSGEVETLAGHGVVGPHLGGAPLWYYRRFTRLTEAGERVRALVASLPGGEDAIARLHRLSNAVHGAIVYETDRTGSGTTAEQALETGHGVCQDHAHTFISAARALGVPARYVSGYLMMNDRVEQTATHAWAEAHVDGLGWVGFDVSNAISADERYVRVATGLDYDGALPVSGIIFGGGAESMQVQVQVQQQ